LPKALIAIIVLLPHLTIFVAAGVTEYRRWRDIAADERPTFLQFLGRVQDAAPVLPDDRIVARVGEADRDGSKPPTM